MNILKQFVLGISLVVALPGCSGPITSLGSVPPADVDREARRPVAASACGFQLLQLLPFNTNGRHERAYAQLKSQAGNDFLGDVRVTEQWYYGVVGSVYCTKLEANAYSRKSS